MKNIQKNKQNLLMLGGKSKPWGGGREGGCNVVYSKLTKRLLLGSSKLLTLISPYKISQILCPLSQSNYFIRFRDIDDHLAIHIT